MSIVAPKPLGPPGPTVPGPAPAGSGCIDVGCPGMSGEMGAICGAGFGAGGAGAGVGWKDE